MNEKEQEVLALLKELKPDADFENSAHFVEDFLLDSFDVITLVERMEEHFGKEIALDDITADNFSSVKSIAALLEDA